MVRSESREVVVSGVPVTVRRIGTGPDVLFVHGVYVNGHVWDDVVDLVAAERTCWVPTLPLGGHQVAVGGSWAPTLHGLADLVPGLLDALELTEATVVGNDSGGGLVLLALGGKASGLSRVGRLVLTNCDSYDHLPPKAFGPLVRLCRRVPRAGRLILRGLLNTRAGQKQFLGSVCRQPVPGDRRAALFGTPEVLDDAVRVTAALAPDPYQQGMTWLARVTLPVDLVWGVDDRFFPKSDAVRLAAAMPQATTAWVEHAKTYVPLDDPAAVARAVLAPQG